MGVWYMWVVVVVVVVGVVMVVVVVVVVPDGASPALITRSDQGLQRRLGGRTPTRSRQTVELAPRERGPWTALPPDLVVPRLGTCLHTASG